MQRVHVTVQRVHVMAAQPRLRLEGRVECVRVEVRSLRFKKENTRGPFKGPRSPFEGPRGLFKGPWGPLKGPRGLFKGPWGPLKGPRGPFKDLWVRPETYPPEHTAKNHTKWP